MNVIIMQTISHDLFKTFRSSDLITILTNVLIVTVPSCKNPTFINLELTIYKIYEVVLCVCMCINFNIIFNIKKVQV